VVSAPRARRFPYACRLRDDALPTCAAASIASPMSSQSTLTLTPRRSWSLPTPPPNCARLVTLYATDRERLLANLSAFGRKYAKLLPDENDAQRAAREAFVPHC